MTNTNRLNQNGHHASGPGADSAPEPAQGFDPLPGEPRTDIGYAHRFVNVHGHRVRYVATWGQWLVWDGRRWAPDNTGRAKLWMKAVARNVTIDTYDIADEKERERQFKDAKRGESNSAVNGSLQLAAVDELVVVDHEDLDADPWLLNCHNGTVDLRTGELRPHDPADLLTKLAGTNYEPAAHGAEFTRFFERIQPDADMRSYLARLLGHTLVGELIEHVLPIFYGDGANGKSTLLDVILDALGDYAGMAAPGLLTAKSFDAHPTEIADLFGLRLARLDETDDGRRLAEGTVKRLTGDRRQKARRMRENFWEFDVSHTFVMLTNHKPLVVGSDEGIWRRLRLIPFSVVIPESERDEKLPERLGKELDAVLAWLVAGCASWQEPEGFAEPETVLEATAEYRAESDALGRFVDECCDQHPNWKIQSSTLFKAWTRWCNTEGIEPGTNKAFSTSLQNRGFDTTKIRGRMTWSGIALNITESEVPAQ